MALPFSAEYHSTPPVQFPSNNPPYVPNIQVLPEGQPLLVFVAAGVANEAAIFSTNSPARMFCYNTLCSNGWANSEFATVVKTACDAAILKTRMGMSNNAATVAVDAIREVLTLYTSMLVCSYPELAQSMAPQQVQAAAANNAVYQDLINQINNMYAQTVSYQPPQVAARQMQSVQPVGPRPAIGQHRQGAQPLTNKAASGLYQGNAARQQDTAPKRFPTPNSVKPVVKEEETKQEVDLFVLTGEIENMDRAQHSIVYFGKEFNIPTAPIRRRLEEAVEIHEDLAKSEAKVESPYVCDDWTAETSLEELISLNRARHYIANDGGFGAYVGYGLVVTPILSKIDLSGLFKELAKSATFADVARVLIDYPETITDKDQLRMTLAAISQIDRVLTKLLNDFLGNMLDHRGMKATSFIEDVKTVASYLNTKFDGKYNSASINYQRRVLEHLFQHTRAAGMEKDDVRDIIDYGPDVYWDNLVVSYSITFLTASSQELGYDVTEVGKEIRAKETPLLRRLVDAVQKTHEKTAVVSHHLLVTSDDARYGVFPVNGNFSTFHIVSV